MHNGYRRLTEQAPQTLSAIDDLFTDNSDTMVQLLGSMATTSQLLYLRVPALNALFPDYRASLLDAHRQHHARPRVVGHRRHLPALHLRVRHAPRGHRRRRTTPSRSCTPIAATITPGCWSAAPRTRRGRPATTPPDRRPALTSVADHRPDTQGPLHHSDALRRPDAADRTAALKRDRKEND